MKLALLAILVATTGCRLSVNKWGGTPPRSTNAVKIGLHGDEKGGALAKRLFASDPRISVVDADPQLALDQGCLWARSAGLDYYATATLSATYRRATECTRYKFTLEVKHDSCSQWRVTSEGSTGMFELRIYDTKTCEYLPSISQQVAQYASGSEDESKSEAAVAVEQTAPQKYIGFPDQSTVVADGHVQDLAGDGEYALFRQRQFQGIAAVHHAGTSREHLHMLTCCEAPEAGDQLVKRGPMTYYELLASFDAAALERATEHRAAYGAGIHVRRTSLAGGLQLGASADAFGDGALNGYLLAIDGGWGLRIGSALTLSANVDLGFAKIAQEVGDDHPSAWAPYLMPHLRAVVAVRWWFGGIDAGFGLSQTLGTGDWSGAGAAGAMDARLFGPFGRFYAGLTL